MPSSVTKLFSYAGDSEGLADAGNHAGIVFTWLSSDGDPSNGCIRFTTTQNSLNLAKEYGRRPSSGQTWESWGVPSGAEVLTVYATLKQKIESDGGLDNLTIKARIVDETGVTIHSAGDLLQADAVPYALGVWESKTGTTRAVDFLFAESTQDVRLELECLFRTQFAGTNVDVRFDSVELTITYTGGSGGVTMPAAVPISNIDGLIFMKGFAYASRIGGVSDAIPMAALQECSIQHGFDLVEARGPESLQPIGVGIGGESLTGTIRHMVLAAEQLLVFGGGSMAYSGGTGKTTYTKLTDEEPTPFNLHLATPVDGSDMEVFVYNCLATGQPIIDGGANREFKTFGIDWRAYGQTTAQGKKLYQVVLPGNATGTS